MLEKVITGGQTGADQAAWRAAKAAGIATGGWMPLRFMTEDGPRPEFAKLYGAQEHPSPEYSSRRRANLLGSDLAVVFNRGPEYSPGTRGLIGDGRREGRMVMVVVIGSYPPYVNMPSAQVAGYLRLHYVRVLMVAGNRASSFPAIGEWVESYMAGVFRHLREPEDAVPGPS